MPNHLSNWIGRTYGQLTVVGKSGSVVQGADRKVFVIWQVRCPNGHLDQRSACSLRVSGQHAICKICGKRNPRVAVTEASQ